MNEKEKFLNKVWPRITDFLERYGAWQYSGYVGGEEVGWLGPYIWGEDGDLKRIITRFCEEEFGFLNVHNESKVDKGRFANFDPESEKREAVDIDVTDASNCQDASEYRNLQHSLFIEVKQISKGCIFNDAKKKIEGFEEDCRKLQHQIENGRCKSGVAILVDDGDKDRNSYVEKLQGSIDDFVSELKENYDGVEPLIWFK